MNVMLDLDGTINYAPKFFAAFTHAMKGFAEIHVVTYRMEHQRQDTIEELRRLNVFHHHLALTRDKLRYVLEKGIDVVFEDMDEFFRYMPESVTVFKIRETDNFDFRSRKWVYDNRTGIHIDDLEWAANSQRGYGRSSHEHQRSSHEVFSGLSPVFSGLSPDRERPLPDRDYRNHHL